MFVNRKLTTVAILATCATAFASTDSLGVTATKPAASTTVKLLDDAATTDVTAIDFASTALVRGQNTISATKIRFRLDYLNSSGAANNLSLAFSTIDGGAETMDTGYTLTYLVDADTITLDLNNNPTNLNTLSTTIVSTVAGGEGAALVKKDGSAVAVASPTTSSFVRFVVKADGKASANLSAKVTVTATIN